MNGAIKVLLILQVHTPILNKARSKQQVENLDVALDGPGFFEISPPQGIRLTRAGGFTIDGNGQLVNKEGHAVLMEKATNEDAAPEGTNPDLRTVKFQDKSKFTFLIPEMSLTVKQN